MRRNGFILFRSCGNITGKSDRFSNARHHQVVIVVIIFFDIDTFQSCGNLILTGHTEIRPLFFPVIQTKSSSDLPLSIRDLIGIHPAITSRRLCLRRNGFFLFRSCGNITGKSDRFSNVRNHKVVIIFFNVDTFQSCGNLIFTGHTEIRSLFFPVIQTKSSSDLQLSIPGKARILGNLPLFFLKTESRSRFLRRKSCDRLICIVFFDIKSRNFVCFFGQSSRGNSSGFICTKEAVDDISHTSIISQGRSSFFLFSPKTVNLFFIK